MSIAKWILAPPALASLRAARWGLAVAVILPMLVTGPACGADLPVADKVVVRKGERQLELLRDGQVIKTAPIALGLEPLGHKRQEGDFRTPEGEYRLTRRNRDSDFFLSIQVSYPNRSDRQQARSRGVDAGGQIMIHGLPNDPKYSEEYYRRTDWTNGCIAVSNTDMIDVWLMTTPNTPIEILP